MVLDMFKKLKKAYDYYPREYWVVILAVFIDLMGGYMLGPFFGYFVSAQFNVDLTAIGFLFSFFSLGAIFGGMFGGAIADKVGRKPVIIFLFQCRNLPAHGVFTGTGIKHIHRLSCCAGFGQHRHTIRCHNDFIGKRQITVIRVITIIFLPAIKYRGNACPFLHDCQCAIGGTRTGRHQQGAPTPVSHGAGLSPKALRRPAVHGVWPAASADDDRYVGSSQVA